MEALQLQQAAALLGAYAFPLQHLQKHRSRFIKLGHRKLHRKFTIPPVSVYAPEGQDLSNNPPAKGTTDSVKDSSNGSLEGLELESKNGNGSAISSSAIKTETASSAAASSLSSKTKTKNATSSASSSSSSSLSLTSFSSTLLPETPTHPLGVKDYMKRAPELISTPNNEPRWFCPLECGKPPKDAPLLLFIPGMDGTGLGMIRHYENLGRMFEVRCLHIPIYNRTPAEGLIKIVEEVVKSESSKRPLQPIYLVGDSLGGALALGVAARNPKVDLVLVLANPSTSFAKSQLQPILPLLEVLPDEAYQAVPYFLSFTMGDPLGMALATVDKNLPDISKAMYLRDNLLELLALLPTLLDIIPKETLLWKLKLLRSAALYVNSRLHAITAEVLLLVSGKDQMLPSRDEGQRLRKVLKNCVVRYYKDSGHTLLLEDKLDLGTAIRGAKLYRKYTKFDPVSDFVSPTMAEFQEAYERTSIIRRLASPVFFSKSEDGKVIQGMSGVPQDGPILLIGYHMLMGLELTPLVIEFLKRKQLIRGAAHPILFSSAMERGLQEPGFLDDIQVFGGLPATKTSFIKALAKGENTLLYPGGAREALHRKGEAYQLFWPEHAEFVRAAARYGYTIVPFGVVGEDDLLELLLDYNDLQKIPFLMDIFKDSNHPDFQVRRGETGPLGEQELHFPLLAPKVPGRMYFLFGQPFRTSGKEKLLQQDRKAAEEIYYSIKKEVEDCLGYLLKKREEDPYRHFFPRFLLESAVGGDWQAPSFDP